MCFWLLKLRNLDYDVIFLKEVASSHLLYFACSHGRQCEELNVNCYLFQSCHNKTSVAVWNYVIYISIVLKALSMIHAKHTRIPNCLFQKLYPEDGKFHQQKLKFVTTMSMLCVNVRKIRYLCIKFQLGAINQTFLIHTIKFFVSKINSLQNPIW